MYAAEKAPRILMKLRRRSVLRNRPLSLSGRPGSWAHGRGRWTCRGMPPCRPPAVRSGIIVVGSQHARSRAQVRYAVEQGMPAAILEPGRPVGELVNLVTRNRWTILVTPQAPSGDPLQVAACCGSMIREILNRTTPDALVVFGGDTALAITDALGCSVAYPYGELLPGVPVSKIGDDRSYTLVTKAGGFAGEQVIEQILERLEGDR